MQNVAVTQDDNRHWHFSPYTDVTQRDSDALSPGEFHYTSQNALPTTTPLVGVEGSALDWAEIEDPGDWEGEDERDWELWVATWDCPLWLWETQLQDELLGNVGWPLRTLGTSNSRSSSRPGGREK